MGSQHSSTPDSTISATEETAELAKAMSEKTPQDGATITKSDKPQPKQSKLEIWLVLISILLAMFLVCLDRTIISTVYGRSTGLKCAMQRSGQPRRGKNVLTCYL